MELQILTPVNSSIVDCIAVKNPTIAPRIFTSDPPEFTGLIAASN